MQPFRISCIWTFAAFVLIGSLALVLAACTEEPESTTSSSALPSEKGYSEAMNVLAERGIVSEFPDGTFRPDDPIRREELAKMVVLTMGFGTPADGDYVDEAVANGLLEGGNEGTAEPDEEVRPGEFLVTAARMAAPLLAQPPEIWQEPGAEDDPATQELAQRELESAGLLAGLDQVDWDAQTAVTRGVTAQVLYNLLTRTSGLPPLSIANYGARDDGAGDDTDAVRAAIDACPQKGTVAIPAGTFFIGQIELKSNITLKGSGASTALVSEALYPLLIEGKSDVSLLDFGLRGSYSLYGQVGIMLRKGANSRITIRGLSISDMGFSGIYLSDDGTIADSTISGCTITHCGDFGIASRGSGSRLLIEDCVLSDFAGSEYPPHGIYFHDMNDLTIRGCEVYELGHHPNAYSGLELDDCLGVLVEDCYMHDIQVGANSDGYGYVAVGTTTVTYKNCRGGGNYYDFYEYALTGSATYEDSPGTKRVVDAD